MKFVHIENIKLKKFTIKIERVICLVYLRVILSHMTVDSNNSIEKNSMAI